MLTPAQRHFQKVMAERRGISDERDAETRTAHEQILFRLHMHKSSLSQIQSRQAKAAVKASILPEFQGWIDGTIEGDSGRADPVITTLMVWAVDCSDYALALRIGRYVVKHGLSMPDDNYRRPAPTVLTEEICNPILNLATTDAGADLSGYIAMLDELAEIVADSDMPDEVRAKLCKVRAFSSSRHGRRGNKRRSAETLPGSHEPEPGRRRETGDRLSGQRAEEGAADQHGEW